jgi:sulfoxide reductase heme-binding subunit YedZ
MQPALSPTAKVAPRRRLQSWQILNPALYVAGLIPLGLLVYQLFNDQLGADPAKELEHQLGEWALRFLIAALAVTPLRTLAGINLLVYRRALGLIAFFYVCLHLLTYTVLDQDLDWPAILADILKRPYITIGMAAFVILIPLAVTSMNVMVRWLGARRWRSLHRWVYLAAALGAIHYVLLVKGWQPQPLIYAALLAVLLGLRLVPKRAVRRPPRRPLKAAGSRIPTA